MDIEKKCNCCGIIHLVLPNRARLWVDTEQIILIGYFFECECGSTLLVKEIL
jgi:hypothetical protein